MLVTTIGKIRAEQGILAALIFLDKELADQYTWASREKDRILEKYGVCAFEEKSKEDQAILIKRADIIEKAEDLIWEHRRKEVVIQ